MIKKPINILFKNTDFITEKLNLDSFYLVGHSMGGLLTLAICEKYPEKIRRAVSIASLYNVSGINFENNRYDFLKAEGFQKNSDQHTNFYLKVFNHSYKRIDEEEKFKNTKTLLENYKENKTVWENEDCSIIDIGDGILNIEFNSFI